MGPSIGRNASAYGKNARSLRIRAASEGIALKQGFEKRLAAVAAADGNLLAGGLKGVEKESLRVTSDGFVSREPHPVALGSALTNRYITTDFSEALLEFVTPAFETTWEALRCICDIHQFTYANLGDELLWTASMPCRIDPDTRIPLARYGDSNVGRMKTIYRRGLGYRYGRQMQIIAGVHFNYSVPVSFWPAYREMLGAKVDEREFRSDKYLGMIRNFRRMGWIVLYLFGASPAVCKSFAGAAAKMPALNADTWFEPYATSLRMSDLGYSNRNQSRINISLNSLDEYVRDLTGAINTPEPSYEKIGVKVDGQYRQLNTNLLQIENEYYSPVRPKRVTRSGEQPTAALRRDGIEYVEIRSLDINMFDPSGINQNTMRFIEAFLLYCLMEDSPKIGAIGMDELMHNHTGTAKYGRDPEFRLRRNGEAVTLREWGAEILSNVLAVAEVIDRFSDDGSYVAAVKSLQMHLEDPGRTLSARILGELEASRSSFFEFAHGMAKCHRDYFVSIASLGDERADKFREEAADSLRRQEEIEASDTMSLDEYLQKYFAAC
jgi:glutamate--cysteine ligase